ncbi:MAG: hypothetical protein E4G89_05950 [Methanothrix sp.]|nr:MAG: hypothetical protein E4G89_05950 [Methanothrix sp.]
MSAPTDKSEEKAKDKADGKWWNTTDFLRFVIAMAIILGFFIILGVAMMGGYADVPTMAGIFSGWIVAIVAFYFMEQASDRAANQQKLFIDDNTQKKLSRLEEDCETVIDDKINDTLLKEFKDKSEYWMKKAEGYRELLLELDPHLEQPDLKSDKDISPRD